MSLARQSITVTVPDTMRPGHTLVVPGLGVLQLQYGHRESLILRAKQIVVKNGTIFCFEPTKKTITDAKCSVGHRVSKTTLIDKTGKYHGHCTIVKVDQIHSTLIIETT